MTKYGVDKNLIAFARSYLVDRVATVQIGNANRSKLIERGCAQGSKCGPGLFLTAMNELLAILQEKNIKTFAYADDLLLAFCVQDIEILAFRALIVLRLISCWGHDSGLHFNPKKTQGIMICCKKRAEWPMIKMGDDIILKSNNLKYLGVYNNKNLTWQHLIKQIRQKSQAARKQSDQTCDFQIIFCQRISYCIVVLICTYAAPAWIDGLNTKERCQIYKERNLSKPDQQKKRMGKKAERKKLR